MEIIDNFYKVYFTQMKDYCCLFMHDELQLNENNYWAEVLKPTVIEDKDFEKIEIKLGMKLPSIYKSFIKRFYSIENYFDTGTLQIIGNKKEAPLQLLYDALNDDIISIEIQKLALIPFGYYNDTYYVCFDLNQSFDMPPIVLFEMENYMNGVKNISHRNWFSNFEKLLECCTDYMINGHSENFDFIDPNNSYNNAYDYWIR